MTLTNSLACTSMIVFMCLQILVLGFCDTQRDLEVVQKILSQVCSPLHHHLRAILCKRGSSLHLRHARTRCPNFKQTSLQFMLTANFKLAGLPCICI